MDVIRPIALFLALRLLFVFLLEYLDYTGDTTKDLYPQGLLGQEVCN